MQHHRINYITDVEGNCTYFDNYISICDDLSYEDEQKQTLKLKDGSYFVYGGDAPDRGWDITFTKKLINLKERYPDRVFLIIGNRDINKILLSSELHDKDLKVPLDQVPGPFWVPKASQVTLKMFLKHLIDESPDGYQLQGDDYNPEIYSKFYTRTNKLKWMLIHTMGCPKTFEFRRQELASLRGIPVSQISDEQVTENFMDCINKEDGIYRRYCELAQIGVCLGNTLFLHGVLSEQNVFFIPTKESINGEQTEEEAFARGNVLKGITIQEWIKRINSWASECLEDWKNNPCWNETRTERGGASLSSYAYRSASHDYTTMINDWTKDGNPAGCPEGLAKVVHTNGISRIVTGHKPFGDFPTIMRQNGVEIVVADTSYSDVKAPDSRGEAFASVVIEGSLTNNAILLRGFLPDGQEIDALLPTRDEVGNESDPTGTADKLVGLQLPDGYWVKGKLKNTNSYALSKASRRVVSYLTLDEKEVREKLSLNIKL